MQVGMSCSNVLGLKVFELGIDVEPITGLKPKEQIIRYTHQFEVDGAILLHTDFELRFWVPNG